MSENEKNVPPRIYHTNDPDGVLDLWKQMVDIFAEDQKTQIQAFRNIIDPDLTPVQFLDLMLSSLGNPFRGVFLTETQKRKLIKLLVPIYKQKGLAKGIENVVRFLTGLEISVIDPHADYTQGWQVGLSEVGESLFAGGNRNYCNMLNFSEDFDAAAWQLDNATVASSAVVGPPPWARSTFTVDLSAAGSDIYQVVTPTLIQNQTYTGSIWIKATAPVTLFGSVYSEDLPSNGNSDSLSVTTEWQRFSISNTFFADSDGNIVFKIGSVAGTVETVYIWGAQLVRNRTANPYVRTTEDATDCSHPGRWAYHFFLSTGQVLTDDQEEIIRFIADYMKTEHTHYDFLEPGDAGFIDHWEVGISRVGVNNFVH